MRGKAKISRMINATTGITPAYAGKSHVFPAVAVLVSGSPPPMRGKGQRFGSRYNAAGITPAYAGKSTVFVRWTDTK